MNYIGVSRRIEDERERARLKETISKVKPDNMGVIVRTAALDKSIEEFEADMRFLTRLWDRIQKKSQMLTAPRLIHGEEPLVFRTIRDLFTPDIDRLTINDREFYEKVQVVAGIISPALKDRVVLQDELPDRFDALGLEGAIDKALCRKVWIKNQVQRARHNTARPCGDDPQEVQKVYKQRIADHMPLLQRERQGDIC